MAAADSGKVQKAPSGDDGGAFIVRPTVNDAGPSTGDAGGSGVSAIVAENLLPGTTNYLVTRSADAHEIEGYASTTSVPAGGTVELFVSVSQPQNVKWELYRFGYYQGLGARLVTSGELPNVTTQAACPIAKSSGLIECTWTPTFSVAIDRSWLSGYYAFKLKSDAGFESYVPLVVRESRRHAPLLMQVSVTTWQAYNLWGGMSLYHNNVPSSGFTGTHANRVSFDRPYEPTANLLHDAYMVRWLEKQGYDVGYATNIDVDADPDLLVDRKFFMSVGHDEYWSVTARDAVQSARDQGLSLGFFSANTAYWRIRLEPSQSGVPRRIMTCYKSATGDPIKNAANTTARFRDAPNARPENALIGIMYSRDNTAFPGFPFVVADAKHWVFAGTGVHDGDVLGNVIGIEWDGLVGNGLTPSNLEVVGNSPLIPYGADVRDTSNATVYYPTPKSFVFAAGCIDWLLGLGAPGVVDARIQRITENVLARAGLQPMAATVVHTTADVGNVARCEILAGSGEAGAADGPAGSASFSSPSGVAEGPAGELFIADTGNNLVRKLSPDGTVSRFDHCPGGGASTCMLSPTGVAVDAKGRVYVSDTGNNLLRVIAGDGTLSTYAGTGSAAGADAPDPLQASFSAPRGLALGPQGELYVADAGNGAIRRIDATGVTTILQHHGSLNAVAVGPSGEVYFTATDAGEIGVVRAGQAQVLVSTVSSPALLADSKLPVRLRPMEGLLVETDGLVFADTGNYHVRRMDFDANHSLSTLIGNGRSGSAVGDGLHTEIVLPRGLAAFRGGYVFADTGNNRILWCRMEAPDAG